VKEYSALRDLAKAAQIDVSDLMQIYDPDTKISCNPLDLASAIDVMEDCIRAANSIPARSGLNLREDYAERFHICRKTDYDLEQFIAENFDSAKPWLTDIGAECMFRLSIFFFFDL